MNVLLLDDHALVRAALETVLQSLGPDVAVHAAGTAAQARIILSRHPTLDLALLDLDLPDGDGLELLAQWRRERPAMPVVIVSASACPAAMVRALDEGARGFIPKSTSNEVLVQAIRMVMAGGVYIPPVVLQGALSESRSGGAAARERTEPVVAREGLSGTVDAMRSPSPAAWVPERVFGFDAAVATGGGAKSAGLRLTPRQSEVLDLLLQGKPNKLIARQLNLSVETVKDHVASLLRVLGVSSRTQAVLAVSRLGRPMASGGNPASGGPEGQSAPPGTGRAGV